MTNGHPLSRREFTAGVAAGSVVAMLQPAHGAAKGGGQMAYGLVTYQWAKDWELPELIANCESTRVLGVELRTTHRHGVEPELNKQQRLEVKLRFSDSPVSLVGLGSNERFDNPDPAAVKAAVDKSKAFVRLAHDVGATGVKVKPDRLYPSVPRERTIAQIGEALNELGEYGAGFGQQIRLEVHGGCAELPTIKAIMDVAEHDNVSVCWNCNAQDLAGKGLAHNFGLVRGRLGRVVHIHRLDDKSYPYAELFRLLAAADYSGWLMLEDGKVPADAVKELGRQRELFVKLLSRTTS